MAQMIRYLREGYGYFADRCVADWTPSRISFHHVPQGTRFTGEHAEARGHVS